MAKFRNMKTLQKFASIHSSIHNHFNLERHLYSRENFKLNRTTALAEYRNPERIRKFLADHESGKTVVPYGENRIVLFNSNLFHETDSIDFKPGYENRRINVTMLFGRRQD